MPSIAKQRPWTGWPKHTYSGLTTLLFGVALVFSTSRLFAEVVAILCVAGGGGVMICVTLQSWREASPAQAKRRRDRAVAVVLVGAIALTVTVWETLSNVREPALGSAPALHISQEALDAAVKKGLAEALKSAPVPAPPPPPPPSQPTPSHAATTEMRVNPLRLFLYDRDPESWKGHRYGEGPIRLDEKTVLEMAVGAWQRFNPQLATPESLFDVNVFVLFPRTEDLEIKAALKDGIGEPRLWVKTGGNPDYAEYWGRFGNINPGGVSGINEAFLVLAKKALKFDIAYVITGRGERSGGLRPEPTILTVRAK